LIKSNINKPFILYIRGGLGNQMFQFACAYSYAKKYDRKLIINTDGYFGYKWNEDAGFLIDQIIPDLHISSNAKWSLFFSNGKILRILGKILRKLFWQKGMVYKEKELFIYDNELMKNEFYDGLYGSFQSPLYFESKNDNIISVMELPISSKSALKFKQKIDDTHNSVGIHYRDYGDLASGDANAKKIIGDVSIQYYKDAIGVLNEKLNIPHYFIFSNNINSAKKKFSGINELTFFNYKSENKWEDMALMSICNHNIICNSSYSWWSAYLNENKDRIVVAPKSWGNLLKGKEKGNNLFPNDWILI
jgi:hypothetical protein